VGAFKKGVRGKRNLKVRETEMTVEPLVKKRMGRCRGGGSGTISWEKEEGKEFLSELEKYRQEIVTALGSRAERVHHWGNMKGGGEEGDENEAGLGSKVEGTIIRGSALTLQISWLENRLSHKKKGTLSGEEEAKG